jgi:predicted DNA-binding transcriptional regulator AlpA
MIRMVSVEFFSTETRILLIGVFLVTLAIITAINAMMQVLDEKISTGVLMAETKLSPRQLAEELGVSPQTLANWRWSGIGPRYTKLGDGRTARVRYRRADVDAWLKARESGAAA